MNMTYKLKITIFFFLGIVKKKYDNYIKIIDINI